MKFENIKMANMIFNTGRDFLNLNEVESLGKDTKIKSIEDDKERFNFEFPLKFGDIKKLFDLEINTDIFNPLYKDENLALGIKDDKFLKMIKSSKDILKSLEDKIEQMKSSLIGDTIVLPEIINKDNELIKNCLEQIQEMIMKKTEKIPVLGFVNKMNEFKEDLGTALETSEKVIEFLKKENLFDSNLYEIPKEMEDVVIKKKEELIEKTKTVMRDIEDITATFDEFMSYVDKKQAFTNMFSHEITEEVTRRL